MECKHEMTSCICNIWTASPPSMMGRLLLSFLVVAAAVALVCTVAVRLVYQKTTVTTSSPFVGYTPRSEAKDEALISKRDSRYVKLHEGIATKQGGWYAAEHVIAESQDFEENRRNETATEYNATSAVTKESGLPVSIAMVDENNHSVERTDAPEISSSKVSSTELASPSISPRSGLGYVLTFSYSDQLTAAVVNVLSLMCLATKFGEVRVVEPFVVNSNLGVNGSKSWTEQLNFRDIFDITLFEEHVSKKHFNQFIPYQTFIKDAPRKVLLVQYCYPCGDQTVWNMARDFCDMNGFELVGKVCLNYGREKSFTIDMLENQIYSHFNKTEVVVLFEMYGGIVETRNKAYRIAAKNTTCGRYAVDYKVVQPSPSVFSDANAYIQRYLNGSSTYISLMIRLERVLLFSNVQGVQNSTHYARQCLNNVLKKWRYTKARTGIAATFLAIDVGTYGSKGFHIFPAKGKAVLPPVEEFFSALFDNRTSLQEWEGTFTSVGLGQTKTSGYIAMMQKVVAVRGDVLILVGSKASSSFQTTSKGLYHKFHGKGEIIELNSKCT